MGTVTKEKLTLLKAMFDGAETIGIVAHTHPDGDALGCTTALLSYLSQVLGKDAAVILPDEWNDQIAFLAEGKPVIDAKADPAAATARIEACDLIVAMDLNGFKRAEQLQESLRASKARKVLIDHHIDPQVQEFDLVFSEEEISSASELTYEILIGLEGSVERLPEDCRTALMTGMTTDTNNFANSVYPSTLRMASTLIDAGTDRDMILDFLYKRYRENRLRAMALILNKMKITEDGVAYMILTEEERAALDLREGETEGFVNMPLTIDRVNFSIFLKEDSGSYYRVSIRSKKGWSANGLSKAWFNGGGHEQAAGGRLRWPEDIPDKSEAARYIEEATARFLHGEESAK